jgi:hypothetical protein
MKLRLKTIKALKKEFIYKNHGWGLALQDCDGVGIVDEMFWMFDGKERDIEADDRVTSLYIFIRHDGTRLREEWQIHKNWIDNSIPICYNEIDDMFKKPL